jgi:REP element-mobilizing transposase RayT
MQLTREGAFNRCSLPHYRSPGGIYHCRFSLNPCFARFTQDWMYEVVEEAILLHNKKDCLVFAYVIMADHSHLVLQPIPICAHLSAWCDQRSFHRLETITGKIKGRSSRLINRCMGRNGTLWQSECFDRTIWNEKDLEEIIDYIHYNPVRWNLVVRPEEYRWSSAHTLYSGDQKYAGWLDLPLELIGSGDA